MEPAKVEAFILFNKNESSVEGIVESLESSGVSTYFWNRDLEPGDDWEKVEDQRLREAGAVVVFLGSFGWWANHLRLARQALELNKRIIPVLIGDPPEGAFDEADGLFRSRFRLDLRVREPASIEKLVRAIRRQEPPRSDRVERILRTLKDGSEEERAGVLRQIRDKNSIDLRVLAERLREEVTTDYAPSAESEFGKTKRPPKFVSSIRSWMISALILADGESGESRELLLNHLDEKYETDRDVRFWTLAGIYRAKVAYAAEALERAGDDSAPEVSALAMTAASPQDARVIQYLRERISTGNFDTAWPALRVLRVIPIPELATDICRQVNEQPPGSAFHYDALYALSSPEMAREAAPVLTEYPGVEAVVEQVIAETGGSNGSAARNFSVLLAALDGERVDRALAAALAAPDKRDAARRLSRHLSELRPAEVYVAPRVAGFTPDIIDVKDDPLDIREDVQTLTAVMMSSKMKPPLAIGLFGDWGSGKSYFMKSMKAAAEELSERAQAGSGAFCANVVSIEFNAWHYADTNLWASLVSYILERLDEYVSPKKSDAETESVLVDELSNAKAELKEAEGEKKRAARMIDERKNRLEMLRRTREQREVKLSELRARDLYNLLPDEEKQKLKSALEEVGLPAAFDGISDLASVVSEAHTARGRANAIFVSLLKGKNRALVVSLVAFVLVVVPLGAYFLSRYVNDFLATATAVISEVVAVVAGVTAVLRRALDKANKGLDAVEKARASAEAVLKEKRSEQTSEEKELQKQIVSLGALEDVVVSKLSAAAARVQELEERIRTISEGRSLARFLAERAGSEDYRKHLGLISTVRRDFEILGARLTAGQDATSAGGLKRVDRIILYIDDLDRCPAEKVMDVLQAVHLLLAYPLFVVVVGVDPRWLLHSLGKQYSAFQGEGKSFGTDPDIWRTTPQNYLEKIFQVPFTLRRMNRTGYGKLIGKLFSPAEGTEATEATGHYAHTQPPKTGAQGEQAGRATQETQTQTAAPPPADEHPRAGEGTAHTAAPPQPQSGEVEDESEPKNSGEASSKKSGEAETGKSVETEKSGEAGQKKSRAPDFVVNEESLVIRSWESDFATRLFALIPTPRAAKRFSNTYRILKATVRGGRLAQFEGTDEVPGDFQAPMLLLALLIGSPAESAVLFPKLQEHAAEGGNVLEALRDFKSLELNEPPFAAIEKKIGPVVSDEGFPNDSGLFLEWIQRVSRFSFDIGRAIQTGDRE